MSDGSIFDLLKPLYEAFVGGQYVLVGALAVIVLVGLLRKFAGSSSWVYSNPGGTLLALVTATTSALVVTMGAPGAAFSWQMLWSALQVGVTAAGGYAALKNLVIDPILRPLAARAPGWMQPLFKVLFYIFDKPDPVAQAVETGNAAVAAKPATGVTSVTGVPTDVK